MSSRTRQSSGVGGKMWIFPVAIVIVIFLIILPVMLIFVFPLSFQPGAQIEFEGIATPSSAYGAPEYLSFSDYSYLNRPSNYDGTDAVWDVSTTYFTVKPETGIYAAFESLTGRVSRTEWVLAPSGRVWHEQLDPYTIYEETEEIIDEPFQAENGTWYEQTKIITKTTTISDAYYYKANIVISFSTLGTVLDGRYPWQDTVIWINVYSYVWRWFSSRAPDVQDIGITQMKSINVKSGSLPDDPIVIDTLAKFDTLKFGGEDDYFCVVTPDIGDYFDFYIPDDNGYFVAYTPKSAAEMQENLAKTELPDPLIPKDVYVPIHLSKFGRTDDWGNGDDVMLAILAEMTFVSVGEWKELDESRVAWGSQIQRASSIWDDFLAWCDSVFGGLWNFIFLIVMILLLIIFLVLFVPRILGAYWSRRR